MQVLPKKLRILLTSIFSSSPFYLFESLALAIHCANTKADIVTPYPLTASHVKPCFVDSKVPTKSAMIGIRLRITRAYHGILNSSSIHSPQPAIGLFFVGEQRVPPKIFAQKDIWYLEKGGTLKLIGTYEFIVQDFVSYLEKCWYTWNLCTKRYLAPGK